VDIELFVHFAEIAGVFVGFGALISLRSANVTDIHDVVYLKAVVFAGYTLLTVVMSQQHDGGPDRPDAVPRTVTPADRADRGAPRR
jgi:hypothetical protein